MKSMDFLVGNLHKSEDFIKDFQDFMDLLKSKDLPCLAMAKQLDN